ncbi:MAG: hypothetical protein B7O98_02030 [Zestosphaera tikiterensis]|uniref:DUF4352 domain-containing protein n=1 Tax=Zestosphaera tikiterensis TaxID=1973259 RepID=A0A2R7Y6X9_9CREN|nr:MAG: hypothetical protein B7O98_02030 [Zestosphaera tikiterensis]
MKAFKANKAVSDLVVVLTLVAIAVPIALALQGWLTSQSSRVSSYVLTPEVEGILNHKEVSGTKQVFVVTLRNRSSRDFTLSKVFAVLSDGTVENATYTAVGSSGSNLKQGTSQTFIITVDSVSDVMSLVFEVVDALNSKFNVNVNLR